MQEGSAKRRKWDDAEAGHPLSIYSHAKPDFAALAVVHPPLAAFLPVVDFGDPAALAELTQALLLRDFDLRVELPRDRLCPTVTSRLNYVLYLHDLLRGAAPSRLVIADGRYERSSFGGQSEVLGFDIGCGASCVYALLGRRLFGWRFVCSELDPVSLEAARENLERNGMGEGVRLVQAPSEQSCLRDCLAEGEELPSFVMCNPPFFEHASEAAQHPRRNAVLTASESATEGGEVAFVTRLIDESQHYGRRIALYSSLCGKKSSLRALRQVLLARGVPVMHSTRLAQGRTHRWVLAWSFCAPPFPATLPHSLAPRAAFDRVVSFLASLNMQPSPCDRSSLFLAASLTNAFSFEFQIRSSSPDTHVATVLQTEGDREVFAEFQKMLAEQLN